MVGHRLPPLNALRAFEATARHLSVKNAADELCVTPGAVSQMLKALERHLGVAMFNREIRAMHLADASIESLPKARSAFRQLDEARGAIEACNDTGVLPVSVTHDFAPIWLVPRLKNFQVA